MGLDDEVVRREIIAAAVQSRAEQLGYLPLSALASFPLPDGTAMRLVDPGGGGIWNPHQFAATLSIVTSPDGPYADRELEGGLYRYSYQKGPEGGKNLKMREALRLGLPLIRFNKVRRGIYLPIYPVYVIEDNPISREFTVTLDEVIRAVPTAAFSPIERAYAERMVRQRVHQPAFRARVLLAYESQCSVCTLKHPELLDAAHIIEDRDEAGIPEVSNGLSLCKIHHAAYDRRLLGISPDCVVHVNDRLLDEVDGPMLIYGLQQMHRRPLVVPSRSRDRPDPDRLSMRFEQFLAG